MKNSILLQNISSTKKSESKLFQIALCLTIHTLTPDNIFTEGLNWGISYDLPNESKPGLEPFLELRKDKPSHYDKYHQWKMSNNNKDKYKAPSWNNDVAYYSLPERKKYYKTHHYYLQRRHRRDLFNKLEVIINA